jgi:hypothetical protein
MVRGADTPEEAVRQLFAAEDEADAVRVDFAENGRHLIRRAVVKVGIGLSADASYFHIPVFLHPVGWRLEMPPGSGTDPNTTGGTDSPEQ